MKAKKYTWETSFQTADETMTHTFSDRVTVILDFKFGIVTILRDGEKIERFSVADEKEMSTEAYGRFLVKIAESAEQLKKMDSALTINDQQ
jgi:hypothetical protein